MLTNMVRGRKAWTNQIIHVRGPIQKWALSLAGTFKVSPTTPLAHAADGMTGDPSGVENRVSEPSSKYNLKL